MIGTFAYTTATITHALLYNRQELALGYGSLWRDFKRGIRKLRNHGKTTAHDAAEEGEEIEHFGDDVHYRLMMEGYKEVPEWWFLIVVLVSMGMCFALLAVYTPVSPAIVLFAPLTTLIFMVPVGIVTAISGMEPSLNLISEMIGGAVAGGDTMSVQVSNCERS